MLLLSVADWAWTAEHPVTATVKLAFEPELERAECECYSKKKQWLQQQPCRDALRATYQEKVEPLRLLSRKYWN